MLYIYIYIHIYIYICVCVCVCVEYSQMIINTKFLIMSFSQFFLSYYVAKCYNMCFTSIVSR